MCAFHSRKLYSAGHDKRQHNHRRVYCDKRDLHGGYGGVGDMNLPIDTCENGACAFAIRVGYDAKCYAGNVGTGGGHYPATSVCVVYQLCGRMRDNPSLRGRSTENYEQRMELIGSGQTCTITSVQKDNWFYKFTTTTKKGTTDDV